MENIRNQLTIEIYEDNVIYISEDGSSGCEYSYENKQDIIDAISDYVNNYLDI